MKFKRYIITLLAICAWQAVSAGTYRIEAESLGYPEQWKVVQTRAASDGRMLESTVKGATNLAHGDFLLSENGKYHIWVRSQSYGQGNRKYKIKIDDADLGLFGDETPPSGGNGPAFTFSKAEIAIELNAGKHTVSLSPDSQNARCDVIILSTTPKYIPPSNTAELAKIQPLTSAAVASSTSGTIPDGKGPNVLLLHGARPWIAGETAAVLRSGGCKVTCIDSKLLAGLGGASIKTFVSDKTEPEPQDGITPEFARLNNYKAVVIMAIKPEDQQKLFSQERLRQLDEYVRNGGILLLLEDAPANLGSLDVVKLGSFTHTSVKLHVKRPESKNFCLTPELWPYLGRNRQASKLPGTQVIASLVDDNNRETGIFAAWRKVGNGKVVFLNTEIIPGSQLCQFRSWAYFGAVMTGLLAEMTGVNGFTPERTIKERFKIPPINPIANLNLTLNLPEQAELSTFVQAELVETSSALTVKFGNKTELVFALEDMTVKSKIADGVFQELKAPKLLLAASPVKMDKSTSEAVRVGGGIANVLASKWSMTRHELAKDGGVTLTLKSGHNELKWSFAPRVLTLAGRIYSGFTDSVEIVNASGTVESIQFQEKIRLGSSLAGHRGWRMACYALPRGFAEIDFSSGKKTTSGLWQFFCSGQPFNWLFSPSGIFCEFVDSPVPTYTEQMAGENSQYVTTENTLLLGKPAYPAKTPALWHLFSTGAPASPNDWMAMYQYQRTRLCQRTGISQAQPLPLANFQNTCSAAEVTKSLLAAKKLGFVQQSLPFAVSANESMLKPDKIKLLHQALASGLRPKPWTASNYALGMDDPVADKHRDWLVYKSNGNPLMEFGKHPVYDFNNETYRKYYFNLIDECASNGLRDIYMDMAGAHSEVINHARQHYSTGLEGLIEVFKYLRGKGIAIAVEGQNPLVLDGFWYRPRLYTDMTAKEFAFVGMVPGTHIPGDELVLDYFRLAMFNAFPYYNVDGYANGFERTPGEIAQVAEAGKLNPMFNAAIAHVGIPFVRQESCGSSWVSKRGGAVFVWHPVAEMRINLPAEWEIIKILTDDNREIKFSGSTVFNVPHKSIILMGKK